MAPAPKTRAGKKGDADKGPLVRKSVDGDGCWDVERNEALDCFEFVGTKGAPARSVFCISPHPALPRPAPPKPISESKELSNTNPLLVTHKIKIMSAQRCDTMLDSLENLALCRTVSDLTLDEREPANTRATHTHTHTRTHAHTHTHTATVR